MNITHLNFNKNIIMEIKTINNKTYVSTGRKDKHGNKIFEGDIVRTGTGFVGRVRYNPKFWRFEVADENEPFDNIRENHGICEDSWEIIIPDTVKSKFDDVEIKIISKNIILLKGGVNQDCPSEYMDSVVKYIAKITGHKYYNQFIENYLDNPYVRVLIFDFNDIDFNNTFDDIKNI